jgi:hypothetical protein
VYPYPGPKHRFKNWLSKAKHGVKNFFKKIGKVIIGIVGSIVTSLKCKWHSFTDMWKKWVAMAKSDWMRFQDWKKCKKDAWVLWYDHYIDLCRTRKALWDDAMREFHRQWHHYKKCKQADYEDGKKKCNLHKTIDYDDTDAYKANVNYYGVTPHEDFYAKYSTQPEKPAYRFDPVSYVENCKEEDKKDGVQGTYTVPVQQPYQTPAPVYRSPVKQTYEAPMPVYQSPEPEYKAPVKQTYEAPMPVYQSPEPEYKAPVQNSYQAPAQEYKTPSQEPTQEYKTPSQEPTQEYKASETSTNYDDSAPPTKDY